jgi:hypothetical protein
VDARAASLEHWSERLRWPMVVAALAALPVIVLDESRGIVLPTPPFLPASLQAARTFRLLLVLRALAAASIVRTLLSASGLRYVALLAVVVEHDLVALHERVRRLERHR